MSMVLAILIQASAFILPSEGRAALSLTDGAETATFQDGIVWIDIPEFADGSVEADLYLEPGRGFSGLLFRAQDEYNGELFYFRHHQSGLPDAWQYHPRRNGHQAYQIYQGEGFAGAFDTQVGQWISVRLEVQGTRARLFHEDDLVADMTDLQEAPRSGKFGFWGLGGERSVRNVRFSSHVTIPGISETPAAAAIPAPSGDVIDIWHVSSILSSREAHEAAGRRDLSLSAIPAGHRGIADLNAAGKITSEHNTVIVRTIISAESDKTVWLDFGFSDDAAVYLNGQPLFAGSDRFRSRDYRFLGTIGFYDSVPLNLTEGDNLLDIVVSEVEGGWGIAGRLRTQ